MQVRAERELRRRGLAASPQPVRAPRPARRPRVPEQPRYGPLSSPGAAAKAGPGSGPGAGPGRAAAARLLVRRVQRGVRPAERLVQLQRELRGRPRGPAGVAPRPPRLRPWELASARAGVAWGGAGAHRTAHGTPEPPRPQTKVREESALRPRRRDRARARPRSQEERGTAASSGSRTDGAADDRPLVQKGSRDSPSASAAAAPLWFPTFLVRCFLQEHAFCGAASKRSDRFTDPAAWCGGRRLVCLIHIFF